MIRVFLPLSDYLTNVVVEISIFLNDFRASNGHINRKKGGNKENKKKKK